MNILKKPLSILLSILLIAAASTAAMAETYFSDGEFEFVKTDKGNALITGCELTDESITIPEFVLDYPIAGIGDYAFMNMPTLRTVTMPVAVVSIGEYAFAENAQLESVRIPKYCDNIASTAFANSPNVKIIGYSDSYAKTYAEENNLKFESADSSKPETEVKALEGEDADYAKKLISQSGEEFVGVYVVSGSGEVRLPVTSRDDKVYVLTVIHNGDGTTSASIDYVKTAYQDGYAVFRADGSGKYVVSSVTVSTEPASTEPSEPSSSDVTNPTETVQPTSETVTTEPISETAEPTQTVTATAPTDATEPASTEPSETGSSEVTNPAETVQPTSEAVTTEPFPETAEPTETETAASTDVTEPTTGVVNKPTFSEPKLIKTSFMLKAGKTATLKVTDGKVKSWKSSKKSVATVKNGKVTALKKGNAVVTATLTNGKKLTCKVKVISSPIIKIGKKNYNKKITYSVKQNKKLIVKITGKASSVNNKYKTSNKKIAKIISKLSAKKLTIKAYKNKGKAVVTLKVNGVVFKIKVKVV